MHMNEKIGDFAVNSIIPFDDVSLFGVFNEEAEESEDGWGVSKDL